MDIFVEYIVKHKQDSKDLLIKAGVVILALLLTCVIFLFLQFIASIGFLLIAGVWYGAYWIIKSRSVEFEYIMTNSSLDIDKIVARSRRKRLVSIDFKEIEICAATDDSMHKYEYDNKEGIAKTLDCTGDGTTDIYFIDYQGASGKTRVLFQPPERIINDAQKFNPRKIFIKQ